MTLALTIAGISFGLLVCFGWLFSYETRKGRRVIFSAARSAVDSLILRLTRSVRRFFVYVTKYVITLSWYYSLHAFLGVILKFLAGMYYVVESFTHRNRDRARQIRRERKQQTKSHLDILTDHKDDTKLTEQQKKKLKDKAINEK